MYNISKVRGISESALNSILGAFFPRLVTFAYISVYCNDSNRHQSFNVYSLSYTITFRHFLQMTTLRRSIYPVI